MEERSETPAWLDWLWPHSASLSDCYLPVLCQCQSGLLCR
jgi:hypothetical protein